MGNLGAIVAEPVEHYARPWSASIRVPPLGAVIFIADDAAPGRVTH